MLRRKKPILMAVVKIANPLEDCIDARLALASLILEDAKEDENGLGTSLIRSMANPYPMFIIRQYIGLMLRTYNNMVNEAE
ncbi:unnamed protein product [Dovyalis caffra]|uniref:Uncharacterized protein n=1 Tax=Dovyalis caffra TaxID=77055 RepID=A0AAV1RUB0_9ROSI|nr:unnamed protein product [Dovyalis caffra]